MDTIGSLRPSVNGTGDATLTPVPVRTVRFHAGGVLTADLPPDVLGLPSKMPSYLPLPPPIESVTIRSAASVTVPPFRISGVGVGFGRVWPEPVRYKMNVSAAAAKTLI